MRGTCIAEDQRPKSPVKAGTSPRRRKSTRIREMNNAENHATVEVKRKIAKEEARYDIMEKGESVEAKRDAKRDMGKPDKPDEKGKEDARVADNITSLPPEDLKNVALLMVLCIYPCVI